MGIRIRTEDEVVVISGKDRGKTGKVLSVDPKKERVVVEGVNVVTRHQRPQPSMDPTKSAGGVIQREGAIHVSNVMLLDPKDKKPTRVGITREGGVRQRVTKRSNSKLD